MAIPRASDPMALVRTLTILGVLGLALATLACVLWLGSMQASPTPPPAAPEVGAPQVQRPGSTPVPARAPRRAPYPGAAGTGPTGTGVVTPSPTLAPGVHPL